MFRCVYVVDS